jgi:hypothetical protein
MAQQLMLDIILGLKTTTTWTSVALKLNVNDYAAKITKDEEL